MRLVAATLPVAALLLVAATEAPHAQRGSATAAGAARVFTGARVPAIGTTPGLDNATIVVRNGRIEAIGGGASVARPAGAEVVDLTGKFVIPGLVAAHVHISDIDGIKPRAYTDANTLRQLALFARYGITTVYSLGGEQAPAFRARDTQDTPGLDRARLYLSGDVVTGATAEAARQTVARLAESGVNVIKIRVDDNLGSSQKMAPEVYRAVIEEAHARKLPVAAHLFYLDDAKALLRAGVDFIAHSVRDRDIDDEFIALMKARNVPYCPTLTRELATFVYESTPSFFSDPFFTREADPALVARLQEPARQQAMRTSQTAQRYKEALVVARRNLKKAADNGVLIAMGTDSGAFPERFQGYYEHLEMAMMAESGLTPAQILEASTAGAARAMRLDDVGVLKPGARADFVVLDRDPSADILNSRAIGSVWIAGNRVAR
jgi:imidazolonepropionase-like amidohydrolase